MWAVCFCDENFARAAPEIFKGIVSRVWGGLQMVWLNRTEVQIVPVLVYF
jgi:hypothetical protein